MKCIKLIKVILIGSILMIMATTTAEARVACNPLATSCYFVNMPLYNQYTTNINSGMLCGPTAGAMALQGVVNEVSAASNVKASTWTKNTFIAGTGVMTFQDKQNYQVGVMVTLMETSLTSGTSSNTIGRGVSGRAGDFLSAGGYNTGYPVSYPNSSYINYVKADKSATTLLYGFYNRTSTLSNGKTYNSYVRNGGHYVTINGFSGTKLYIYNPANALKQERQITIVKNGCNGTVCESLPGGLNQRSIFYASGDSFNFVDHHTRLWAD